MTLPVTDQLASADAPPDMSAVAPPSPLASYAKSFFDSPLAGAALAILVLLVLTAIAAPLIAPQNPYALDQLNFFDGMLEPLTTSDAGMVYWLGTDEQGRDMLSAILYGMRTSLLVGVTATAAGVVIGAVVGVVAAYMGGVVDAILMRLVDLQLSFPAILISLMLLAMFGRGTGMVIIALMLVQWAYYARVVRATALAELNNQYVEAARCMAFSHTRIVFRHLLPGSVPSLIVLATVQIAHAIALESTLSFLGLGTPVTRPSLGMLIASGYEHLLSGRYWVSTYPGIALVILVLAINLVGDRLRDVLNPRLAR